MQFWEAMKAMSEGKKVRIKEWDKGLYIFKAIERGAYLLNESLERVQYLTDFWINCKWELYEEAPIQHSFYSALEKINNGKRMRRKEWLNSYTTLRDEDITLTLEDIHAKDWVEVK